MQLGHFANNMTKSPTIGIVVPCYNEEEVILETSSRLKKLLDSMIEENLISNNSYICFVDDGSKDKTWPMIEDLASASKNFCGIKLSRNKGHQNALLCGLMTAKGDALISLDADLQDDIEIIPTMIRSFIDGKNIIYAVRRKRTSDSHFKRITAEGYYRLLNSMGVEIVFNHADYRLMSRCALEALREYSETHLFLRGMIPQLGFSTATVEFDRAERFAGESKYPLHKMLSLAWQGVTSFSAYPLRLITGIGMVVSVVSILLAAWALGTRLFTDDALPGWASTVIPMYFLGGIQLLGLGIIGEYLAKVYEASKMRPRFHIESRCGSAPREHETL